MTSIHELYELFQECPQICTDTRNIKKGSIFFALRGSNFNGNEFAERAIAEGCNYAIIDDPEIPESDKFIFVADVLKTLQQLATHHRKQLGIPIVAVTGTNGKTTTKELIREVLLQKFKVHATVGNLNNHIGVPLTLLSLTSSHEIAVVEMGANHLGEIDNLCKIAEPNFGLITNIGKAHLEGFGGMQGVIKAKSELYRYIKTYKGTLFVNYDNSLLRDLSSDANRITYGTTEEADFVGRFIDSNPFVRMQWRSKHSSGELDKKPILQTKIVGKYNFENILAAACIGDYFGITDEHIRTAIENYVPSNNRSQVVKKESNTILLDAYNANPSSMEAAILNFSEMESKQKIVVLGDMLELGSESLKEHQRITELALSQQFNEVILVGDNFYKSSQGSQAKRFTNNQQALDYLKKQAYKDSTFLIKGSRGIKLENLVEVL